MRVFTGSLITVKYYLGDKKVRSILSEKNDDNSNKEGEKGDSIVKNHFRRFIISDRIRDKILLVICVVQKTFKVIYRYS